MRTNRTLVAIAVGVLLSAPLAFAATSQPADAPSVVPAGVLMVSSEAPPTYGGGASDTGISVSTTTSHGIIGSIDLKMPATVDTDATDRTLTPADDTQTTLDDAGMTGEVAVVGRSAPQMTVTKVTLEKQVGPDSIVRAAWADGIGVPDLAAPPG